MLHQYKFQLLRSTLTPDFWMPFLNGPPPPSWEFMSFIHFPQVPVWWIDPTLPTAPPTTSRGGTLPPFCFALEPHLVIDNKSSPCKFYLPLLDDASWRLTWIVMELSILALKKRKWGPLEGISQADKLAGISDDEWFYVYSLMALLLEILEIKAIKVFSVLLHLKLPLQDGWEPLCIVLCCAMRD